LRRNSITSKCPSAMSATNNLLTEITEELESTWGYTREELDDIREKLVLFAKTVAEDATMTQEVKSLANLIY
jgi:hypothetical protein